jgi:hypothetical protein
MCEEDTLKYISSKILEIWKCLRVGMENSLKYNTILDILL